MGGSTADRSLKPALSFIKMDSEGRPFLEGYGCERCGETYLEMHRACPRCFAVGSLQARTLSTKGKLYNYTIVHRSFPGIEVPFISAIVDLEGGGTLMGNLLEVPPDPSVIQFDMPVELVFRDAGRTDKADNRYLAYFFVPEEQVR